MRFGVNDLPIIELMCLAVERQTRNQNVIVLLHSINKKKKRKTGIDCTLFVLIFLWRLTRSIVLNSDLGRNDLVNDLFYFWRLAFFCECNCQTECQMDSNAALNCHCDSALRSCLLFICLFSAGESEAIFSLVDFETLPIFIHQIFSISRQSTPIEC